MSLHKKQIREIWFLCKLILNCFSEFSQCTITQKLHKNPYFFINIRNTTHNSILNPGCYLLINMECFFYKYKNNTDFFYDNQNAHWLLKDGFIRSETHLYPYTMDWEIDITHSDEIKELLIRCTPIIGNILGFGKLYSLWSTRDPEDRYKDILFHTLSGVLETLGLGVVALILKITLTMAFYFLEFLEFLIHTLVSLILPNSQSPKRFSFL